MEDEEKIKEFEEEKADHEGALSDDHIASRIINKEDFVNV
jgi:hypothetical protein